MDNIFNIKDEIVVVTGGLGLLGREYTLELLKRGARVGVADIPREPDETFKSFINYDEHKKKFLYGSVDITDRVSIEKFLTDITERWDVPNALINNAALDSPPDAPVDENGPFEKYPDKSWDKVMEVNVKGVFLTCQIIGGAMAETGKGSIVNICSIYGMVSPDQNIYEYRRREGESFFKPVAYSASKSALLNLTRYLATYWAPKRVRVNTLTLGGVYNGQDRAFLKGYCAKVPLNRMAEKNEYNGAIIFLISDASSYMTGSNLVIDGGWTAW